MRKHYPVASHGHKTTWKPSTYTGKNVSLLVSLAQKLSSIDFSVVLHLGISVLFQTICADVRQRRPEMELVPYIPYLKISGVLVKQPLKCVSHVLNRFFF